MAAPRGIPGMNPYTGKAGIGDAAYQSRLRKTKEQDMVVYGDDDPDFSAGTVEVDGAAYLRKEESARADVAKRFTYHPPKGDQQSRYVYLRNQALNLATDIVRNCPDSRERSLALTKLEEAIMWANASIARNE